MQNVNIESSAKSINILINRRVDRFEAGKESSILTVHPYSHQLINQTIYWMGDWRFEEDLVEESALNRTLSLWALNGTPQVFFFIKRPIEGYKNKMCIFSWFCAVVHIIISRIANINVRSFHVMRRYWACENIWPPKLFILITFVNIFVDGAKPLA